MRVVSQDFNDGDKMPERHVFNGMGYQGDNLSPHLAWDEVPAAQKLCGDLLRSGCPDRLWLVALGSRQYSG